MGAELVDVSDDGIFADVIAEEVTKRLAGSKVFCQGKSFCDAACLVLHAVSEIEAAAVAGAKKLHNIAHVLGAGDDQDLCDARIFELTDRVHDHGFAPDRKQVFVGDIGERRETRTCAAGQDDAFHKRYTQDKGITCPTWAEGFLGTKTRWRLALLQNCARGSSRVRSWCGLGQWRSVDRGLRDLPQR